jgi:hypothetical protein
LSTVSDDDDFPLHKKTQSVAFCPTSTGEEARSLTAGAQLRDAASCRNSPESGWHNEMSKRRRVAAACGVLGLLIALFFFMFVGVLGVVDGTLYTAMVVLCPPSLLSIPFGELMKEKTNFYVVSLLIGLLNCGLYASVGAAMAPYFEKQ